jgi:hypothetical protein
MRFRTFYTLDDETWCSHIGMSSIGIYKKISDEREATGDQFLSGQLKYVFFPDNNQKLLELLVTCRQHHSRFVMITSICPTLFSFMHNRCTIQFKFWDLCLTSLHDTHPLSIWLINFLMNFLSTTRMEFHKHCVRQGLQFTTMSI